MGGAASKSKYIDAEEETRRLLDGEDADGHALDDDDDDDDSDGSEVGDVGGARTIDLRAAAQQRQAGGAPAAEPDQTGIPLSLPPTPPPPGGGAGRGRGRDRGRGSAPAAGTAAAVATSAPASSSETGLLTAVAAERPQRTIADLLHEDTRDPEILEKREQIKAQEGKIALAFVAELQAEGLGPLKEVLWDREGYTSLNSLFADDWDRIKQLENTHRLPQHQRRDLEAAWDRRHDRAVESYPALSLNLPPPVLPDQRKRRQREQQRRLEERRRHREMQVDPPVSQGMDQREASTRPDHGQQPQQRRQGSDNEFGVMNTASMLAFAPGRGGACQQPQRPQPEPDPEPEEVDWNSMQNRHQPRASARSEQLAVKADRKKFNEQEEGEPGLPPLPRLEWHSSQKVDELEAVTRMQAVWRGERSRQQLHERRQAARKIQALQRGKARRRVFSEQWHAANRIQATYRGRVARQAAGEMTEQRNAARMIQSRYRGNAARRRQQEVELQITCDVAEQTSAAKLTMPKWEKRLVERVEELQTELSSLLVGMGPPDVMNRLGLLLQTRPHVGSHVWADSWMTKGWWAGFDGLLYAHMRIDCQAAVHVEAAAEVRENAMDIASAVARISGCYYRKLQKLGSRQQRRAEGEEHAHKFMSPAQRDAFQAQLRDCEALRPEAKEKAATIEVLMNVAYGGAFSIGLSVATRQQHKRTSVFSASGGHSVMLARAIHGPKTVRLHGLSVPQSTKQRKMKTNVRLEPLSVQQRLEAAKLPRHQQPKRRVNGRQSRARTQPHADFAQQRRAAVYIQKVERGRQARFHAVKEKDEYDASVRDDRRRARAELAQMGERLRYELESLASHDRGALKARASHIMGKWLSANPDASKQDIVDRMLQLFERLLAHLREVGQREGIPGLLYHAEQSNISDVKLEAAQRLNSIEGYIVVLLEDTCDGVFWISPPTQADQEKAQLAAIAELSGYSARLRAELEALPDEELERRASLLMPSWLANHPDAAIEDVIDRLMAKFNLCVSQLQTIAREQGITGLEQAARPEQSDRLGITEANLDVAWSIGCAEAYIVLILKHVSDGVFDVKSLHHQQLELARYLACKLSLQSQSSSSIGASPKLQPPVASTLGKYRQEIVSVSAEDEDERDLPTPETTQSANGALSHRGGISELRAMAKQIEEMKHTQTDPITSRTVAEPVRAGERVGHMGSFGGIGGSRASGDSPSTATVDIEAVERAMTRQKQAQERAQAEARRAQRRQIQRDELEIIYKPHLVSRLLRQSQREDSGRFASQIANIAAARPRFKRFLEDQSSVHEKIDKMVKEYMRLAARLHRMAYPLLLIEARELGEQPATRRLFQSQGHAGRTAFQKKLRDIQHLTPDKVRKTALIKLILETQYGGAFHPEPQSEPEPEPEQTRCFKARRSSAPARQPDAQWNSSVSTKQQHSRPQPSPSSGTARRSASNRKHLQTEPCFEQPLHLKPSPASYKDVDDIVDEAARVAATAELERHADVGDATSADGAVTGHALQKLEAEHAAAVAAAHIKARELELARAAAATAGSTDIDALAAATADEVVTWSLHECCTVVTVQAVEHQEERDHSVLVGRSGQDPQQAEVETDHTESEFAKREAALAAREAHLHTIEEQLRQQMLQQSQLQPVAEPEPEQSEQQMQGLVQEQKDEQDQGQKVADPMESLFNAIREDDVKVLQLAVAAAGGRSEALYVRNKLGETPLEMAIVLKKPGACKLLSLMAAEEADEEAAAATHDVAPHLGIRMAATVAVRARMARNVSAADEVHINDQPSPAKQAIRAKLQSLRKAAAAISGFKPAVGMTIMAQKRPLGHRNMVPMRYYEAEILSVNKDSTQLTVRYPDEGKLGIEDDSLPVDLVDLAHYQANYG